MAMLLKVLIHPAYILACFFVGITGRKRRLGFFGFTLLSYVLTPLTGIFVLFAGAEKTVEDEY